MHMILKTNDGSVEVPVMRENEILAVHPATHNRKVYSITLKAVGLSVMTDITNKRDAYRAFHLLTLLHKDRLGRITMDMVKENAPIILRLRDEIAPIVRKTKLSYLPRYWREEALQG